MSAMVVQVTTDLEKNIKILFQSTIVQLYLHDSLFIHCRIQAGKTNACYIKAFVEIGSQRTCIHVLRYISNN